MQGNIFLLLLILVPILLAFPAYFFGKKKDVYRRIFSFLAIGFILAVSLYLFINYNSENVQLCKVKTLYPLSLELDGFRIIHVLLAAFLWTMTGFFSKEYFLRTQDQKQPQYTAFNLLTLGAVLGVFLSANLFTLFIFFEIMSFTSYGWVIHDDTPMAKRAGNTYLAVSVISGMVMLMGLFLLNNSLGTLEISEIVGAAAKSTENFYLAGGMIVVGFGAKAGMYPLHIWLPKAYPAAPAPASALLSALLSKAGVFGIIVISSSIFLQNQRWGMAILILGAITMLWGGICALLSDDMKQIISHSSMSQIGFILVGIGMQGLLMEQNSLAIRGTVLHMINHSIVKLILFTLCGILFMNLGSHKLTDICGYARKNVPFGISFIIAMLSLCGVPLFGGYISKTLLHESIVEYRNLLVGSQAMFMSGIEWIFLISGGLTVAYMLKITVVLFAKKPVVAGRKIFQTPLTSFCILLPALFLVVLGAMPGMSADRLADMGQGLMHGLSPVNPVKYFSVTNLLGALISLAIGFFIYFIITRKFLIHKSMQGETYEYKVFPKWFDLETRVYRPIFMVGIPRVLGVVCTFLDRNVLYFFYKSAMFFLNCFSTVTSGILDHIIARVIAIGFKPAKIRNIGAKKIPIAYKFGSLLDKSSFAFVKKPQKGTTYAQSFSKYEEQSAMRRRMIASSLSYGLLFAGLGLVVVMLYLLFT